MDTKPTDFGLWTLDFGHWTLDIGLWTLDIFQPHGSLTAYGSSDPQGPPGAAVGPSQGETGRGQGLGYTLNAPIRYGTPRKDYRDRFTKSLEKAADKIKPELVLISAGFDAHSKDPIGSLGLETEDFTTLTKQVLEVAKAHSKGRLVSCLEGGYDVAALAESVEGHLKTLLAS